MYARRNSVLYWQLSDNNVDVSEVARDIRTVKKKFKDGDVPIWDRLGNSGRKQKDGSNRRKTGVRLAGRYDLFFSTEHYPPRIGQTSGKSNAGTGACEFKKHNGRSDRKTER